MKQIFSTMGSKEVWNLKMRESWAFVGIKGKKTMSEMRRNRKTKVRSGRTWMIRTRTVKKSVTRRFKKVVIRRRVSVKSGRRVRIRSGRKTTGGRIGHSIKVMSAGFEAGNYAKIYHNNRLMKFKTGRGLNIFAWTSSWKAIGGKAYDTYARTNHGLVKDFARVPNGSIIAMACKDECSRKLTPAMKQVFSTMGSKEIWNLKMRESWAFIGIKGKKTMSEMRRNRKTRVQAGRTWNIRTRMVRKTVNRRVIRRTVRGKRVYKTVRRVRRRSVRRTRSLSKRRGRRSVRRSRRSYKGRRSSRRTVRRSRSIERCSGRKCSGYRGYQTRTRKGHTCQAWNTDSPQKRDKKYTPQKHSILKRNYCRNPIAKNAKTIWCYTTNPKVRWDYCTPRRGGRRTVRRTRRRSHRGLRRVRRTRKVVRKVSRKNIIKRRVVIKRRVSMKSGKRIRMRGGRVSGTSIRHSLRVESAGFEAGNYARIYHNGRKMKFKTGRGLNIYAWTSSWKPIGGKAYDTYARTNHGLVKDFAKVPNGSIIAMACKDECSRKLTPAMKQVFSTMGSKEVWNLKMRESWAFVGIKGKKTMSEMRRNRKTRV
jgi:hypothetical protein